MTRREALEEMLELEKFNRIEGAVIQRILNLVDWIYGESYGRGSFEER